MGWLADRALLGGKPRGRGKGPPKRPITFGWEYLPKPLRPQDARDRTAAARSPVSWGWGYLPKQARPANARRAPVPKAPLSWGWGYLSAPKPSGPSSGRGSGGGGWFSPVDGSGSSRSGGWSRLY